MKREQVVADINVPAGEPPSSEVAAQRIRWRDAKRKKAAEAESALAAKRRCNELSE